MKNEYKGIASLVASTFIYSFFGVLTRIVGFSLPVFYAMCVRGALAVCILLTIIFITHRWNKIKKDDWKWFMIRSCGGILGFLGSFFSFYYIPLGTAYFIFYGGSTIGGYVLGRVLFYEKLTNVKTFSLILALLGLFLIYYINIQGGNALWMMLAFVGGIGTAIWNVCSKKISGIYPAIQLNLVDFLFTVIFAFFASMFLREQWILPSMNTIWLAHLLFVFLFISTGQLMVYGFRHLDAQIGSLIMLTEVLFGILIGFFVYHEILSVMTVIGGVLILGAIILPEIRWKKLPL